MLVVFLMLVEEVEQQVVDLFGGFYLYYVCLFGNDFYLGWQVFGMLCWDDCVIVVLDCQDWLVVFVCYGMQVVVLVIVGEQVVQ